MRKIISITIVLCLITNIAFAGEIKFEKKNPDKIKRLTGFPGFLLPGLARAYAGDVTFGVSMMTFSLVVWYDSLVDDILESEYSSLVLMYGVYEYFMVPGLVEEWNEAVETGDFSKVRDIKLHEAEWASVVILWGNIFQYINTKKPPWEDWQPYARITLIGGILAVGQLIEISLLPKNGDSSNITLVPLLTPEYGGAALVKRF